MNALTYISYSVAALQFLQAGHRFTLVLLSVILMIWFGVLGRIAELVTPESTAPEPNGWTTALSRRSADTLQMMQSVSTNTATMSLALSLFGPLLVIWALLPS